MEIIHNGGLKFSPWHSFKTCKKNEDVRILWKYFKRLDNLKFVWQKGAWVQSELRDELGVKTEMALSAA